MEVATDVAVPREGKRPGDDGNQDSLLVHGRSHKTVSPALHGCTLEVNKGDLVAVVGPVGSGKSR